MARVTVGYKDTGQPIYKALDYFSSRSDALICLANYNDNPGNVDLRNATFEQVFNLLKADEYPKMGESLKGTLNAAYKHCSALYKLRYRDIRKQQMQKCIDTCGKSYATQTNIRNLFIHLDRIAFDYLIISRRCSETLTVSTAVPKQKEIFTDTEIKNLFTLKDIDPIIFMLYTGFRISEVLLLTGDSVDLEAQTITGGIKTEAGKNRVIPIHQDLLPLVKCHMGSGFLFYPEVTLSLPSRRKALTRRFETAMGEIGAKHTSHDCRHTFRSKLDSAGANKVCIDLLMGHKSNDVGERVYTHKTIEELRATIALLRYPAVPSVSNT